MSPTQHGPITVYHGDNRQVLKRLDAASVDAVVTDAPYGLSNPPSVALLHHVLSEWMVGREPEYVADIRRRLEGATGGDLFGGLA